MAKRCFFIGHRGIGEELPPKLRTVIKRYVEEYGVKEFIAGKQTSFDRLAAQTVKLMKKQYPDIRLVLLCPNNLEEAPVKLPAGFDRAFYPFKELLPEQIAAVRAGRMAIDMSDHIVACVSHSGRAMDLLNYAMRRAEKFPVHIENLSMQQSQPHEKSSIPNNGLELEINLIYNGDRFESGGDSRMPQEALFQYFHEHYLPREEVMYRLPVSVSLGEFWPELLKRRRENGVELPLKSWDGHAYWYVPTEKLMQAGDRFMEIARDESIASMPQYAHDEGVIDEAYYSSAIEGAYTTRQRAREFIVSGAAPKDRSERMILNNYTALRFVLEHLDGPINEAVVLEIARILTDGTLDAGVKPGYRNDDVQVVSGRQEVVYVAPDEKYVKPMMDSLLRYISDPDVHPIIKACVTHIYFVTVHPFFDGNGRTARALSYMILLKAGYRFIRQFPISGILAQERSKYYKAIRAAQSPENGYDFTYFLEYYASMLHKSIEGLHEHMAKFRRVQHLASHLGDDRESQRLLRGANWLVSENIPTITAEKWRNKFKVSFETARQDLMKMEKYGFFTKRTVGRNHFYDIATDKE